MTSAAPSVRDRIQRRLDLARAAVVRVSLRLSPSEAQRVLAVTLALGAVCGLVAVAFHEAIRGAQELLFDRYGPADGTGWIAWVVLVPAAGGVLAGLVLQYVVPSARGSGIPQVKTAYALDTSGTRLRDAVGKFGVCVLQLGSGASLGREGPTVQICAGVATSIGRWLALSPANLRRLIPVGAAAGVAAAFNAPIAAVTFVIEEIVGTLDGTVLSGVVIAAALAAVVEHSILGGHPVLQAPVAAGLHHAASLPLYVVLGVLAGFASIAFTDFLLATRERFRRASRLPEWSRPGVGGLATGALAAVGIGLTGESGIAGGGYETLSRALHGELALHVLALLCVLKLLATVASYSSGGAGGIFAPTLFVGAMLGGLVGNADVWLFGHEAGPELSSFALVGMGAVFAGVVRAPMTSVLIVFEMTGGYELVLPLMIANVVAYAIARHHRPTPIYEALLAQDGVHLPHGQSSRGPLLGLDVRSAMTTAVVTMPATVSLTEAAHIARANGHATYPVLDERGQFVGLLSEARIQRSIAEGLAEKTAGDVARRKEYAVPDEALLKAVARMQRLGVRQLPVLAPASASLCGILAMSDVLRAQVRAMEKQDDLELSEKERESLEALSPSARQSDPSVRTDVPKTAPREADRE
jgi:CIC family chloride channel protein